MLPIAGSQLPAGSTEFANGLRDGLLAHGITAEVTAEGAWPELSALTVQLNRVAQPRPVSPASGAEGSVNIDRLLVIGAPVVVEGVPAQLKAEASSVKGAFARTDEGSLLLVAQSAASGTLHFEARTRDVEAAVHQVVSAMASKQGVNVKQTRMSLSSPGPRTVNFEVTCDAKVFIASASITVAGSVEIDDQLNATARGVRVVGEGMIVNMARGILEPKLAEVNGRTIPLGSYVAAGLAVKDLHIATGEALVIEASFAPKA